MVEPTHRDYVDAPTPFAAGPAPRRASLAVGWASLPVGAVPLATMLVMILGIALRVGLVVRRTSLEMDEQMLALNLVVRPAARLLERLDLQQVAPPLFLLLERAMVVTFGSGDLALRAIPLLAGLAVLPLLWRLLRALDLPPAPRLVALALACVSPVLVFYSAEAKPYAVDCVTSVVLTLLALRVLEAPEARARWGVLIAAGVVAVTLSLPAVFVLAGVGAALVASPRVRAARRSAWWIAGSGAAWLASFAPIYLALYAPARLDPGMRRFWAGTYLADRLIPLHATRAAAYVGEGLAGMLCEFDDAVTPLFAVVVPPLLVVGVAWVARRRGAPTALLLALPMLGALAASAVGHYVMTPRLMLFALPMTCAVLGAGVAALDGAAARSRARPWARRALYLVLGAAITLMPLRYASYGIRHPEEMEVAGPLAREFLDRAAPDEPVYVYARAVPAWLLYTTDWRAPDEARVERLFGAMRTLGFNSGLVASRGRPVAASEGAALVFPFRRAREVIGVPTGVGPDDAGRYPSAPDSGWAVHEAARIRAVAAPRAWLYLSHFQPSVGAQLLAAVRAAGGRETYAHRGSDSWLYRFTFPVDDGARAAGVRIR